ncbi:MAG TPA: hypothetical protein VFV19_16680 [Candidatus Polarisedimenticolaceae bacterium]|nr:hypothetical protein [Candidatus Polarisedimenticolaceae bacterium]
MKRALVTILLAAFVATIPTLAQEAPAAAKPTMHAPATHQPVDLDRFKEALTGARRKLFAASMSNLSAEQLQAFWGVYADYEKEKDAITSSRIDLAKKYVDSFASANGVADADIEEIVTEMVALQHKTVDLRLKYFEIYRGKLDAKTAGRFALVDDYITTAMRLDLLDQIPFPGDKAAK